MLMIWFYMILNKLVGRDVGKEIKKVARKEFLQEVVQWPWLRGTDDIWKGRSWGPREVGENRGVRYTI